MLTFVLGAPGSGKSAVTPHLRDALPDHVVLDWDAFLKPASELAGGDVRSHPELWPAYRELVRAIVEALTPLAPVVLLGPCTPDELTGWPVQAWMVLDCADDERANRLASRTDEIAEAVGDAARYRELDLRCVDSTGQPPEVIAAELARIIRGARP